MADLTSDMVGLSTVNTQVIDIMYYFIYTVVVYVCGGQPMFSTIEDIYVALVDTDRGQKEKVHFYDTAGLVNCAFHYLYIFNCVRDVTV